jgi:flavin reductase ActVB
MGAVTERLRDVAPAAFRSALARFPSGVTIVTTRDDDGAPWGFTASAFSSLSLRPPLVLVCLDRSADCHPTFTGAQRFAVNILTPAHERLARRFATKGADKYGDAAFAGDDGAPPMLEGASAVLQCETEDAIDAGDHTILIGRVTDALVGEDDSVVYYRGVFVPVPALDGRD